MRSPFLVENVCTGPTLWINFPLFTETRQQFRVVAFSTEKAEQHKEQGPRRVGRITVRVTNGLGSIWIHVVTYGVPVDAGPVLLDSWDRWPH